MTVVAEFKVITEAWKAADRDIQALDGAAHRAVMWGLREVGRQTKREARKRVRVYRGGARTVQVTTGGPKGARSYGKSVEVVPGLLKKSITSPRALRRFGPHEFGLTVGPRGGHAHLYAQKIELLEPYMEPALETVRPRIRAIHEAAMAKALRRYGP